MAVGLDRPQPDGRLTRSVGAGAFSYYVVERPFLKLKLRNA